MIMTLLHRCVRQLRTHPVGLAATGAAAATVLLGVPTGVIATPWFEREVPVRGFEVLVLVALSLIAGLFAATYAQSTSPQPQLRRTNIATGVIGWFAVSCPLCNPAVVALLGTSGATGIFATTQPALGALAVALATIALALRLRAIRQGTCHIPVSNTDDDRQKNQPDSLRWRASRSAAFVSLGWGRRSRRPIGRRGGRIGWSRASGEPRHRRRSWR